MPVSPSKLFQQSPVQGLLVREAQAVAATLGQRFWERGLFIGMVPGDSVVCSRTACGVSLALVGDTFQGSVRARIDEALPFADEAFPLVVISHVLEWVPHAHDLLHEAARVLAPQGTLVVTGFHPLSAWLPWLLVRRHPRPMLTAPGWLRQRLAGWDVDATRVIRFGACVPGVHDTRGESLLGGSFAMLACKHRAAIMTLRTSAPSRSKRVSGAWVSGTHRESA